MEVKREILFKLLSDSYVENVSYGIETSINWIKMHLEKYYDDSIKNVRISTRTVTEAESVVLVLSVSFEQTKGTLLSDEELLRLAKQYFSIYVGTVRDCKTRDYTEHLDDEVIYKNFNEL